MSALPLLTPGEMAAADAATIAAGTPGFELMQRAGGGVVAALLKRYASPPTLILCGPGNNGGDGYVVAELLRAKGWPVRVASFGDPAKLKGDARLARAQWQGDIEPLEGLDISDVGLVVDALFGAGLDRPLPEAVITVFGAIASRALPVVAVDIASGVHGATGEVLGAALPATLTVTFAAAKPGHYLYPGAAHRGELSVVDIGIEDATLAGKGSGLFVNTPALWLDRIPRRQITDHKYRHGHALILGGPAVRSGAARLAAEACQRIGAGLTTLGVPAGSEATYAAHLTTVMQRTIATVSDLASLFDDPRFNALLIGPGYGVGPATRSMTEALLDSGRACVIDADALTSFADAPASLFRHLHGEVVLTPHDGEFARLFDATGSRLERARQAARQSGAVVLLKGADSVVAAPDGRAAIASNPSMRLATAGTGDVLAGCITGLLARGVPAFFAACAANWLNNDAAMFAERSFIAEDLPRLVGDRVWLLGR